MTISLIVCTLGRTEPLRRLLASLRTSAARPLEILVVDQNPPGFLDPVLLAFGELPLARVTSEKGLSRARNVGLALARGDVVAFPDDDCWYPADLIGRVAAAFAEDATLALLMGRTVDAAKRTSVSPHLADAAMITRHNVFRSGNSNGLFVRRPLAATIRFDETLGVGAASPFQSGEETDFVLRCLGTGAAGRFDPSLIIHHDQGDADAGRQLGRVRGYSAGYDRVLRLHGYGWRALAAPVARAAARAALCAARLDREGVSRRRAWISGALRGYAADRSR